MADISELDYLTKPEFKEVVTSLNDNPPSEADLEAAWVLADEDQSGGIDFDEFVLLYAKVLRRLG